MMQATYLVFYIEKVLAIFRVDNRLKPILVCICLFSDQAFALQVTMRRGKIHDIDSDMMAIIFGLSFGLFVAEGLSATYLDLTGRFPESGSAAEDLLVKPSDTRNGSCRDVKFHVGNTQLHFTKLAGRVAFDLIAPGTGNADSFPGGLEREPSVF